MKLPGGTFSFEDYFRANVEKKLFIKVPEQEDYELTPATRLLEKRREMLEVETGLKQQKEEFSLKMDTLAQRREELARKESQLKESLMKFDKFLKENDAKRARALKKALDERRMRETKESEISRIKESLNVLQTRRVRQGKSLDHDLAFQRFLENVLEKSEEFGELKDIISRFDTLSATNHELLVRSREAQDLTERSRLEFARSIEEKNNRILNYNNEIAKMQALMETTQLRTQKCQQEWDRTLKSATQKSLMVGQVKMATNNIFNLVKSHLNNRVTNTADTPAQLDRIQQFMLDLMAIAQEMDSVPSLAK